MDTRTIITIVAALSADGRTVDEIYNTLIAMGVNAPDTDQTAPVRDTANGNGSARPRTVAARVSNVSRGAWPSKLYRVVSGMTATRLAKLDLPPREAEIADAVLAAGKAGISRRSLTDDLNHATKKIAESGLMQLRVRRIVESFPNPDAQAPAPAPRRGVRIGR